MSSKQNDENLKREIRINSRLNIKKLPFKISEENFCLIYGEMYRDMRPFFKYHAGEYALKWCLSTEKRLKIFLLIFDSNEYGIEIYKESIAHKLPEYSYKTVAQIIDDGIKKKYFVKLSARHCDSKDSKIRNIRPSEDLIVQFVNWQIDLIKVLDNFKKKYS